MFEFVILSYSYFDCILHGYTTLKESRDIRSNLQYYLILILIVSFTVIQLLRKCLAKLILIVKLV